MKNSIKFLLLMAFVSFVWSCTNDDVRVTYPASTPSIDTAKVAETQITYGDSIHLRVAVSDKVAPLSTVVLKVVVNNEVVVAETVRTKGNQSSFSRKYRVPFVPHRPDNADVKIYLTSINVEGYSKDTIFSTTKAKRPAITEFWYFGDGVNGIKMTLTDPANYIYKITGQLFGTTINFKIGSKAKTVFGFKRLDWTGFVYGKGNDGFGLIDTTGQSMSITDASLTGISEVTFDAYNFTVSVGGKKLEPVKTLDITADLVDKPASLNSPNGFRGGNVYFGEGVEVTFTGVTDLANNISPDYFQVTGTNTAKFLGKTGLYKAYFMTSAGYLYIEPQPDVLYPDVLWVCGSGFSRPQAPYTANPAPWNWNSPIDYAPARLVSPGVYQVTMYCKNEPSTDVANPYGKLDFKFFHKRGWWDGHELWVDTYTLTPPFLGPTGVKGNVKVLSETVLEGIYRFTVNENNKTFTAVKIK